MKNLLRYCMYKTTSKYVDEAKLEVRHIKLSQDDISYFNLSSNPIASFTLNGKLYYFRECMPLLSKKEHFARGTEGFFASLHSLNISGEHFKQEIPIVTEFSEDEISSFRRYLEKRWQDKAFLKSLARADKTAQKTGFSIWTKQSYDQSFFDTFGFSALPSECYHIAVYFLWYVRSVAWSYRFRKIARGKRYSYFSAVRSVASTVTAKALGLGPMLTAAEFCRIETDEGNILFGVLSNSAEGIRMADTPAEATGALQKELTALNVFDAICFQTDHGPNNYNVYKQDGEWAVCAFDNDNPNTFLPIPTVKNSISGCSSLVDAKGLFNRPYMSKELFENLKNADIVGLKKLLKPYLNFLQMRALASRIKKTVTLLERSVAQNSTEMISDAEWGSETVAKETDGRYGKTYLTAATKS